VSVNEQLTLVFKDLFGPAVDVSVRTTAKDIDGWDSVAHINLMFMIEESFGIEFAEGEFETFETVGALCAVVEQKLAA